MSPDDPTTEELKAVQVDRERTERELEKEAAEEAERRAHARRADKASYLAEKLDEQAEADEE
jgi:hypothetical protein